MNTDGSGTPSVIATRPKSDHRHLTRRRGRRRATNWP